MEEEMSDFLTLDAYDKLVSIEMIEAVGAEFQDSYFGQIGHLLKPDGLALVMEAEHFCMQWRGVRDNASKMINSVMRGAFLHDPTLRREFLSLLNLKA